MMTRAVWFVTADRRAELRLWPRRDDLGPLQSRRCGVCHRPMSVLNGHYLCPDHGYEGRILTVEEEKTSSESCDPRWKYERE